MKNIREVIIQYFKLRTAIAILAIRLRDPIEVEYTYLSNFLCN